MTKDDEPVPLIDPDLGTKAVKPGDVATGELLVEANYQFEDMQKFFAWAKAKHGTSEEETRRLMDVAIDHRNARNRAYSREARRREEIGKPIFIVVSIVGFVVLGTLLYFVSAALRGPCHLEYQGECLDSEREMIRGHGGY